MRPTTLWIPISSLLLLSSCGSGGNPVALSSETLEPRDPATSLLIDVPLPGFVPRQVNLIEEQIFATTLPILSPNYAVVWTGSFTDGRILAQSRSNLPITLDPCTIPFGEQTLTASAYNPLDFGLFFPLTEADVNLTIDPGCDQVSLDFTLTPQSKIPLPPEPPPPPPAPICDQPPPPDPTPPPPPEPIFPPSFEHGVPYELKLELLDPDGNLITDLSPFEIEVVALNPDTSASGSSDTWTVSLSQDLGTLELEIRVILRVPEGQPQPEPVIQQVSQTDVCNLKTVDDCFPPDEDPEEPDPPQCIDPTPTPDPMETPPPPPPPPPDPLPPPPPPPPCRGNCGSTIGDPHYTTLDGLYYDFQGAGEYTLIRSADGQFVVQTRMQPWFGSSTATVNTGVATQVGSQRINVLLPNVLVIDGEVVDGTNVDLALDGGRLLRSGDSSIAIFWNTGDFIQITIAGSYINVRAQPDPLRAGQVSGLLGNFNGDPMDDISTADGVVLNQPINIEDLYKIYGESWRITQGESLFFYGAGESNQTFTDPNFPQNPRTPEQLFTENPQAAIQAQATCQAQGITDPILLEACQLDVFVTGDPGFTAAFLDETVAVTPEIAAVVEGSLPLDTMDPILVSALRRATGIQSGPIFPSDLANIRSLSTTNSGPVELTGISSLRGLETADLSSLELFVIKGSSLTDFSGLPNELPSLRFLGINNNNLASLSGLPLELPSLISLQIVGNRNLSNLLGLPIELPNLQSLSISGLSDSVVNLSDLPAELPRLESLFVSGFVNSLIGLPSQLNSLQTLSVVNSNLTSLSGLPIGLPNLDYFEIRSNGFLTDLSGFPGEAPNLRSLSISSNPSLLTLSGLPTRLPRLTGFSISGNGGLGNLSGMPTELPFLRDLFVSGNLNDLSGLGNSLPNLVKLTLTGNINSLSGLPELPNLTTLNIETASLLTNLLGLPSELPSLTSASINRNRNLTSLSGLPSALPNLISLSLFQNSNLNSLEGLSQVSQLNTFNVFPNLPLCPVKDQLPEKFLEGISCP